MVMNLKASLEPPSSPSGCALPPRSREALLWGARSRAGGGEAPSRRAERPCGGGASGASKRRRQGRVGSARSGAGAAGLCRAPRLACGRAAVAPVRGEAVAARRAWKFGEADGSEPTCRAVAVGPGAALAARRGRAERQGRRGAHALEACGHRGLAPSPKDKKEKGGGRLRVPGAESTPSYTARHGESDAQVSGPEALQPEQSSSPRGYGLGSALLRSGEPEPATASGIRDREPRRARPPVRCDAAPPARPSLNCAAAAGRPVPATRAGGCRGRPGRERGRYGCGLVTLRARAFRRGRFPLTCSPGRVRLWLQRGPLRRWLYLFMWLVKDVAGLMRGKCAPAGVTCLQPDFAVSPLTDIPSSRLRQGAFPPEVACTPSAGWGSPPRSPVCTGPALALLAAVFPDARTGRRSLQRCRGAATRFWLLLRDLLPSAQPFSGGSPSPAPGSEAVRRESNPAGAARGRQPGCLREGERPPRRCGRCWALLAAIGAGGDRGTVPGTRCSSDGRGLRDPAGSDGLPRHPRGTAWAVVRPFPALLRVWSVHGGVWPGCGGCCRGEPQKRVPEGRPSSAAEESGGGGRRGPLGAERHRRGAGGRRRKGGVARRAPCGAGPGPRPRPAGSEPRRGEALGKLGEVLAVGKDGRAALARRGADRAARTLREVAARRRGRDGSGAARRCCASGRPVLRGRREAAAERRRPPPPAPAGPEWPPGVVGPAASLPPRGRRWPAGLERGHAPLRASRSVAGRLRLSWAEENGAFP
ncbi:collagen alpha-1(I) chain-like [Chiroxiphia lanceolata]|uniref:collagen alpha-1(I) chain-like n=1 Tax=Chiroxiphia lanceolata TaxID=296741 RepID=UPI0013CE4207|nr:collagen alpha-1(I) chain-like [Chiroxiphia lanceolata]